MNYSLSSTRKIGDYIQKIITTHNNAVKATSATTLYKLSLWHTAFSSLDANDREVGAIEYNVFTEAPSASSSNLGTKADIIFTVLSTETLSPKTTTITVRDVTLDNFSTALNEALNRLIGYDVTANTNYLISAILNLH